MNDDGQKRNLTAGSVIENETNIWERGRPDHLPRFTPWPGRLGVNLGLGAFTRFAHMAELLLP